MVASLAARPDVGKAVPTLFFLRCPSVSLDVCRSSSLYLPGFFGFLLECHAVSLARYPRWIAAWDAGGERPESDAGMSERLHLLKEELPPTHKAMLWHLFGTLCLFLDHQHENRMTVNNLAICVAPNFLRPLEDTEETILGDAPKVVGIVAALLERHYAMQKAFAHDQGMCTSGSAECG